MELNNKRSFGIGSVVFGGIVILMAFGVFPMDKQYLHTPEWVYGICGLAFVIAGFVMIFQKKH